MFAFIGFSARVYIVMLESNHNIYNRYKYWFSTKENNYLVFYSLPISVHFFETTST